MKPLILALMAVSASLATPADSSDVMMKAMTDELTRSATRLELEGHKPPYYISYTVHDNEVFHAASLFGAITDVSNDHSRDLDVSTRVGDYHLDSNFSQSDSMGADFGRLLSRHDNSGRMPLDNDYDAIRHMLWLRTDSAYKGALRQYESAKSYLERNIVKDRPDSFSAAEPTTVNVPLASVAIDKDKWIAEVRKLSTVFRNYPDLHQGSASFSAAVMNRWFVNNEGTRDRLPDTGYTVSLSADTDAEDGMHLFDQESVPALDPEGLPADAEMEKLATNLAERLVALRKAPVVEDYRGPIIFEGQSAADFFNWILSPHLAEKRHSSFSNAQLERLGQRILPNFIDVVDDPTAKEFKGQHLLDAYEVDDEGVTGKRIKLVEKGILKTLCMTRTPNKLVQVSNGHCRNGVGAPSNLFITSQNSCTKQQLKDKLVAMGKDQGLKYVYIVRKLLAAPLSMDLSSIASLMSMLSNGSNTSSLPAPVLLYRVSVDDGHEELVRGAQFNDINDRTLRDIEFTADDDTAYPISSPQSIKSLVTPSILISEVEIQKSDRNGSKPPLLTNPLFEKK